LRIKSGQKTQLLPFAATDLNRQWRWLRVLQNPFGMDLFRHTSHASVPELKLLVSDLMKTTRKACSLDPGSTAMPI